MRKKNLSSEVNAPWWSSWFSSSNLEQKFQILLNSCHTSLNSNLEESYPDSSSPLHVIARSQLTSFAKRHFETILLWCLSILSGFWAVTFKRVLEARYLRALRGERPLKPPPASAAVTPRTGGSPAPAPFSLRRRGGRLPGTPRAGNLPPAARCVPATAGARGATGQAEPPLQPSPAQPGGEMEGEPPARFFSKGSLKCSTGARSRESSFWISVLLLFISFVRSKYEAFQRAKRVPAFIHLPFAPYPLPALNFGKW